MSELETFNAYHRYADRCAGVGGRIPACELKPGAVLASGETVVDTLASVNFWGEPAVFLTIRKHGGDTYGRQSAPNERWAVAA